MRISERVQQLVAEEHADLLKALKAANDAVQAIEDRNNAGPDLEEGERWSTHRGPLFTSPWVDLKPLRESWNPFRNQTRVRVERIRTELLPLVERLDAGEDDHDSALKAFASELSQERESLEKLLSQVKAQVMFLDELKPVMRELYYAVEACDRAVEGEIVPALLAGSSETAEIAARFRTSDDIARSLRTSVPKRPPPPPPEPQGGLVSRLFRSFLKK